MPQIQESQIFVQDGKKNSRFYRLNFPQKINTYYMRILLATL
jgi:hypothetical protein